MKSVFLRNCKPTFWVKYSKISIITNVGVCTSSDKCNMIKSGIYFTLTFNEEKVFSSFQKSISNYSCIISFFLCFCLMAKIRCFKLSHSYQDTLLFKIYGTTNANRLKGQRVVIGLTQAKCHPAIQRSLIKTQDFVPDSWKIDTTPSMDMHHCTFQTKKMFSHHSFNWAQWKKNR